MSNIYVIADLHLSAKLSDEYRFTFMNEHFHAIAARGGKKIDAIVVLGDLAQEKDHHAAYFVNRVVETMRELTKIAPVIILMGNHDYANEGQAFFEFLRHIPGIYFISKPLFGSAFPIDKFKSMFRKTLFLPHTRNYKKDWDGIPLKGWNTIFAHNTFTGADTGSGHLLSGIRTGIFDRNANVISGDIHFPQKIGPVTYVGCPYTINFGDKFRPRLFRGSPLMGDFHSVYVDNYPQKRVIEIAQITDLATKLGVNAGDLIEIRLQVESMANWQALTEKMLEWCAKRQVHLIRPKPILIEKATRKNVVVADSGQSDKEVIEKYGKRRGVDNEVLQMGLHIFGG